VNVAEAFLPLATLMEKPRPVSPDSNSDGTMGCKLAVSCLRSSQVRSSARFAVYLVAAWNVKDVAHFCVHLDVSFASGMCADSAYALFTF
jgi:hypothetical protein